MTDTAGQEAEKETVERVARALEAHARETYRDTDVAEMLPPDWEPWIGSARAAIKAMRMPKAERWRRRGFPLAYAILFSDMALELGLDDDALLERLAEILKREARP